MTRTALKVWKPCSELWPIDLTRYNCSPELTNMEREALTNLVTQLGWKKRTEISNELTKALIRLLQPLHDIQERLGVYQKYCTTPIQVILRAMHERSTPYWAWSEEEWTNILQSAFTFLEHSYDLKMYRLARQQLMILAYVLGPQTDFFWPFLRQMSPSSLASKIFGTNPLLETVERIYDVIRL